MMKNQILVDAIKRIPKCVAVFKVIKDGMLVKDLTLAQIRANLGIF